MQKWRTVPALLLAACLAAGCSFGPSPEQRLLEDTGTNAILPGYQDFRDRAATLNEEASTFCKAPGADSYADAREAWKAAMAAWQVAQAVHFGPVTIDNQPWKIQFWPDRNNLIDSKLNALLAGGDAITPQRIDRESVTIQGLSAAEYLLFDAKGGALERYDSTAHDDAGRRCEALLSITAHTEGVAAHLLSAWLPSREDYLATLTSPGEENPDFALPADAVGVLLDSILETLETVRDHKLADPLGKRNRAGFPQPYGSEAWRSRYSLPLMAASLDGLRSLYYAGEDGPSDTRFGFDDLLREHGAPALATTVDSQFRDVGDALPHDMVLFDAVNDPHAAAVLETLHASLGVLLQTINNELPEVLGVTLGFNANDGD